MSDPSTCAVKGCEAAAVEVGTVETDGGLVIRTPNLQTPPRLRVREGIAGRRWELLLDHDRYTVERER